jgi:hypothetical protein
MDETTQTADDFFSNEFKFKNLSHEQKAEKAVDIAVNQLIASTDFKAARLARISKYWELYNGSVKKKLRQLFNVPIPVFPGMIDTLNAQYDTPIQVEFSQGDPSDYFKIQKINGAFRMETLNSQGQSKWEPTLRMARKHAIIQGRGIVRYDVESDPEYKSGISVVRLKNFHFQPRGGKDLENHLFAGEEGIERSRSDIIRKVMSGKYNKEQAQKLLQQCDSKDYLPDSAGSERNTKLERFKPIGLNPDTNSYVGESIYSLAEWIMQIDGERWYLLFHPWSKTWLRFEKWKDICTSGLYPWDSYATHEDDENFLSKSYGDDLYVASDAIVGMLNQELTNREKRNNGSRAYDKDMFTDPRKLDEAMHRPDGLVAADTKGGTKRIAEGVYEFKTGELNGTVNLIDWITGSLGQNTGANELARGQVTEVSKKASVTFAEQKSVAKRVSWASASFQEMMASLANKYVHGLKDHMPAKMAIRVLGENGYDWDEITRLDLDTTKSIDVVITSTDKQVIESEMRSNKRKEILTAISTDPTLAAASNPQWRLEQMLMVAEYDDVEINAAMDNKNFADRKAIARASGAVQDILLGKTPQKWFGANRAYVQHITDYAADKRATLGDKYEKLLKFAMNHIEIVKANIERQVQEEISMSAPSASANPSAEQVKSPIQNSQVEGGISRAMKIGNEMAA